MKKKRSVLCVTKQILTVCQVEICAPSVLPFVSPRPLFRFSFFLTSPSYRFHAPSLCRCSATRGQVSRVLYTVQTHTHSHTTTRAILTTNSISRDTIPVHTERKEKLLRHANQNRDWSKRDVHLSLSTTSNTIQIYGSIHRSRYFIRSRFTCVKCRITQLVSSVLVWSLLFVYRLTTHAIVFTNRQLRRYYRLYVGYR